MANYNASNVYVVTSSAAQAPVNLPYVKSIDAVKYFSNVSSTSSTTSTAAILSNGNNSTGSQVWFENRVGGAAVDYLNLYDGDGFTVSMTGGGTMFIYGRVHRS